MNQQRLYFPIIVRFFIAFILLGACSPTNFEKLQQLQPELYSRNDYQSYLAMEYLDFARSLQLAQDRKKAEYFSIKGLKMAENQVFIPENPLSWRSDKLQIEELILTQKRLERLLYLPNLKQILPIQLAHLSYLYDCWIAKESQTAFRESGETKCRTTYHKLLDEIEDYIKNPPKKKKFEPKSPPEFVRFEVIFDEAQYSLNDKATKEIFEILHYLNRLTKTYKIYLIGNGDNATENFVNQTLAANRVQAVRSYLVKNGVIENAIFVSNQGENFPDIITTDNQALFYSRNVGIYVINGDGEIPFYPLPLLQNLYYRQQIKDAKSFRGYE